MHCMLDTLSLLLGLFKQKLKNLFIRLAATNGILSHISQNVIALLTGITVNQHLLVQSHVWECVCCTWSVVFSCLSFLILLQYDTFPISHILFSSAGNLMNILSRGLHDPLL